MENSEQKTNSCLWELLYEIAFLKDIENFQNSICGSAF